MRTLAAIRTHRWGAAEDRLAAHLTPVFGPDLAVAFHNRPAGLRPSIRTVDFNDDWVDARGLFRPSDYGWRCGDYAFYALREAMPDYDYYWLIEPDVYFTSSPQPFFATFDTVADDALGSRVEQPRDQGRFTVAMEGVLLRATFALTRLSGRAIDAMLPARQAMSARTNNARFYPNDEFFAYSTIHATPGMTIGNLETHAPSWFDGTSIAPSPDLLLDAVQVMLPPGRVAHPVLDRDAFINGIAARLAEASEFAQRMRLSLSFLTKAELDSIAYRAAAGIRAELERNHATKIARRAIRSRRLQGLLEQSEILQAQVQNRPAEDMTKDEKNA